MRNASSGTHPRHGETAEGFSIVMAAHLRAHALAYEADPHTLICPAALQQYARLVMLFELFPAAPYVIAPHLNAWRPHGYIGYFVEKRHRSLGFVEAAARHAPREPLSAFLLEMSLLDETAESARSALRIMLSHGKAHEARAFCASSADLMREGIERARALAGGGMPEWRMLNLATA